MSVLLPRAAEHGAQTKSSVYITREFLSNKGYAFLRWRVQNPLDWYSSLWVEGARGHSIKEVSFTLHLLIHLVHNLANCRQGLDFR